MIKYKISHPTKIVNGKIQLPTSKSISNRLLIINALASKKFDIENLAESEDTQKMLAALTFNKSEINVGAAGTTSRFLTALLSITKGEWILKGTERLHQRPIKPLVDALLSLGARISYLNENGCLPLKIVGRKLLKNKVEIKADVSSQFISALLLIAPGLDNGLEIDFIGNLVSKPYVNMTLALMEQCGAKVKWEGNRIVVSGHNYRASKKIVEADWSSASYLYSIASLSKKSSLVLKGLNKISVQGDAQIYFLFQKLGVKSNFEDEGLVLNHSPLKKTDIHINFEDFPDMAQTIIVLCAALNINGYFTGLDTLRIKETDRIAALQKELQKLGCEILVNSNEIHLLKGVNKLAHKVEIDTYHDHRMALAFAPLALVLDNVVINDPLVVNKSYPFYWKDLKSLGFEIQQFSD